MHSDAWQRYLVDRPASPGWLAAARFVVAATAPAMRHVVGARLAAARVQDLALYEWVGAVEATSALQTDELWTVTLRPKERSRALRGLAESGGDARRSAVAFWLRESCGLSLHVLVPDVLQSSIAYAIERVVSGVSRVSISLEDTVPLTESGARFRLANAPEALVLREHIASVAENGADGATLAPRAAAGLLAAWERRGLCDRPSSPS